MPNTPINLIKGDKIGDETDYRDALPVNMYAVNRPVFGANGYMIQSPGLTLFADGMGVDRGGFWNDRFGIHFRVSGKKLISVNKFGVVSELGSISGSDTASMTYSFNTQAIVADGNYYLYDTLNGFRQVTDPNVRSPLDVVWIDGFYCFTNGEDIYHTTAADEEVIDPASISTAEFMPDGSLGCGKTQDNKWMVFGRYSIEYFRNVAGENFSFQRVEQRTQKIGIVGTHCKAEVGAVWYILGGRRDEAISVHGVSIGSTQKVATREVEKIIGLYAETDLRGSVVETYEEDGYTFILVHLPNHTLQFNQTIAESAGTDNAWTILKTDVVGDETYRGIHGVFDINLGKWVFGDKRSSNIGILDSTVATHYDEIAEWLLFTPFYYLDSQSIDKIEIKMIPGHTDFSDANVFISLSYDGVTHGTAYTEEYGMQNDYNKRWLVRRLGYVRDWVSIKLRGASRSRMAFSAGVIKHG